MDFKFKSRNSLNHLSLHDCVINHAEWIGDSLIFYMDWVDVLKTHPYNSTGKAKVARIVALLFENATELSCFYYDLTKAEEEGRKVNKNTYSIPEDAEIITSSIVKRCNNTEISEDEETMEDGKIVWTCSCNNDTEFKITYSIMWVCFNALEEDSWFEF